MPEVREIDFRLGGTPAGEIRPLAEGRYRRARAWVLAKDQHCRRMVAAGRTPQIHVPDVGPGAVAVRSRGSLGEYHRLRLGIGALVRPVLLDPPPLEPLYPFQREGVRWLVPRRSAILADDMGVGKTVQAI